MTYYQNHREKYHLTTNQFFSYRKHNTIYFRVIVRRKQLASYTEQQNLGSTENSVYDLQQEHRKDDRLLIEQFL